MSDRRKDVEHRVDEIEDQLVEDLASIDERIGKLERRFDALADVRNMLALIADPKAAAKRVAELEAMLKAFRAEGEAAAKAHKLRLAEAKREIEDREARLEAREQEVQEMRLELIRRRAA